MKRSFNLIVKGKYTSLKIAKHTYSYLGYLFILGKMFQAIKQERKRVLRHKDSPAFPKPAKVSRKAHGRNEGDRNLSLPIHVSCS